MKEVTTFAYGININIADQGGKDKAKNICRVVVTDTKDSRSNKWHEGQANAYPMMIKWLPTYQLCLTY